MVFAVVISLFHLCQKNGLFIMLIVNLSSRYPICARVPHGVHASRLAYAGSRSQLGEPVTRACATWGLRGLGLHVVWVSRAASALRLAVLLHQLASVAASDRPSEHQMAASGAEVNSPFGPVPVDF